MKTFLFLGDSITDSHHNYDIDNLGEGYVRIIAEKLDHKSENIKVINKGFDGFTIAALNRLWKRDGIYLQPDFVTILIGINDIAVIKNTGSDSLFALKEYKMNYQSLITQIRSMYNVPILLMEPFIFPCPEEYKTWESELKEMHEIIKQLAEDNNLMHLPLWDSLIYEANHTSYQAITTDGIHLTRRGHEIIASLWTKKLIQFTQNLWD